MSSESNERFHQHDRFSNIYPNLNTEVDDGSDRGKASDQNVSATKLTCSKCGDPLLLANDSAAAACDHKCHRTCVQPDSHIEDENNERYHQYYRFSNKNTNSDMEVDDDSDRDKASDRNVSATKLTCSKCGDPLVLANDSAAAEYDHKCHRTCAQPDSHIDDENDSSVFPKKTADEQSFDEARMSRKSVITEQPYSTHLESDKHVEKNKYSTSESIVEDDAIVYILDLPVEIENNTQLEKTIQQRLFEVFQIESTGIQYYSNIGIALIHLKNKEQKSYLVNVVGKIAWNSRSDSVMISFKDKIQFESYIVLEREKEDNELSLPKPDEIVSRWIHFYNGEKPLLCEQLNSQYPNIYRIITESFRELLNIASKPNVIIKNRQAQVYPCAYCSFFEDLSISTTENELRNIICDTIGLDQISSSSLYIQLNNSTNNACILATNTARKWANEDSIYIGCEFVPKRKYLSYYLLLRPIRQKVDIDAIIRHQIFSGKAKLIHSFGRNLILKIHDKNIYDKCLSLKTFRFSKGTDLVNIEVYIGTPDPNKKEIDAETWYDGEMLQCEPNIMPFIQQGNHKIFRLQWNAEIWLEQFERIGTIEKQNQNYTWGNEMRHRLRVTVMLNTFSIIREKTYTINDEQFQLNLNPKLETIVYNHKSKLRSSGSIPIKRPPFKRTEVKVINDDCLVIYENLVKQGKKPVLLNMASATSPGGGYRKGDGAQEENLFRRSDYFRSLDTGLDQYIDNPSDRYHCTSESNLDPSYDSRRMYPIDEYGAIYTSGLTVFRRTENEGYAFMADPLRNVCSIAMPAYRHPALDGNLLSSKYAVGMRKKIENIFSIAYHHQHDSLVLSALGCGAFRNPPEHIAKIFRSVSEQYAGFFQLIIFAIVDDHNTGFDINPDGNFSPFEKEFQRSSFNAIQPTNRFNTTFGPYRFSSDGSIVDDICIFVSTPCKFGGKCRDICNSTHSDQFSHPPLCIETCMTGKCAQMDDIVHMASFIHRYQCPNGAQCKDIDNRKHVQEFEHPSYCPKGSACEDTSEKHEKAYRHLPLCKSARNCEDYRRSFRPHCEGYRHCRPSCQYGRYCVYFHDKQHMDEYQHPFGSPCPWTPFHCDLYDEFIQTSSPERLSENVQQHCLNYAHVCPFGQNCPELNPSHWQITIHVPRKICPLGKNCSKLNQEEHLNSFTHPNIQDIRYLCKNDSKCPDYDNTKHKIQRRHRLTDDNSSIVPYFDSNININFYENQRRTIDRIMEYAKRNQWEPFTSNSISEDILDWMRTVRPVYQCRSEIFELFLLYEYVMSRQQIESLTEPQFLVHHVLQHNRIKSIDNLKKKQCEKYVQDYILALKTNFDNENKSMYSNNEQDDIQQVKDSLSKYLQSNEIDLIHRITMQTIEILRKIPMDNAHSKSSFDKKAKTDEHVLTALGPYLSNKYDGIILIFEREILHHPNANFSIQTTSSYRSGKCFQHQPWLGTETKFEDELIKFYHQTKLNASIPEYEKAAALELIASANHSLHKRTMNIDLDTILHSRNAIEARLPHLIPFDSIDKIYIRQETFDLFNDDISRRIQNIFGSRLEVLPSRSIDEYHRLIANTFRHQFNERNTKSIPRPIQGFILTIPPTKFQDNLLLPVNLYEAYEHYRTCHSTVSSNSRMYIYWQVNNGDMMLTLSNQQIHSNEPSSTIRALLCYIAEKPKINANQDKEYPSYLNLGQPFQHQTFVDQDHYAAKSTSFYRGCNLNDIMTFCLEIESSTGIVQLSHAGSNSIYNHQIISYQFHRSDIDLSKLQFLYISAGNRSVSIRNLFVTFEKQTDLHPTIDMKLDTNSSPSEKAPVNNAMSVSSFEGSMDQDKNKNIGYQLVENTLNYFNIWKNPQLTPCKDGIYCFTQFSENGSTHNSKYSHPCRFGDICRNPESNLTHEHRPVNTCRYNEKCHLLSDPFHRAKYRHNDLPYFLIPCRDQSKCTNKSQKHRMKYSHGEKVL